jgi:hypothetical protein
MNEKQAEARLAEIRRRNDSRKKFRNAGDATLVATTDDIDFLLFLLQQPATSERCGECHHERRYYDDGRCRAIVLSLSVTGSGMAYCNHECVYSATGAAAIDVTKLYNEFASRARLIAYDKKQGINLYAVYMDSVDEIFRGLATTGAGEGGQQRCRNCGVVLAVNDVDNGQCGQCGDGVGDGVAPATVAEGEPQTRKSPVKCDTDNPPPHDGSECEYSVCPRPRVCFHYCEQHHKSICAPTAAPVVETAQDEPG